MKKFLFTALLATLVLSLTSCPGEDEPEINAADLIGMWDQTQTYYIYKIDGKVDEEGTGVMPDDEKIVHTFKTGGTVTSEYHDDGELYDTMSGTWALSGSTLTIVIDGDTQNFTVETLNSTTLVFSESHHYVEDGATCDDYDRYTFIKAK